MEQTSIEAIIKQVSIELTESHNENARIAEQSLKLHTHKIRDQRQERIENLKQQLRGSTGGGGCIKIFRPIFKVLDLGIKPLTKITAGKLNLELTNILNKIQNAKDSKVKLGYDIKNKGIARVMTGLKAIMNDDLSQLNQTQQLKEKDSARLNNILEQIYSTYKSNWYT